MKKYIGIWIDHSHSHLMELTCDPLKIKMISSEFTLGEKEQSLNKIECLLHNKEHQDQSQYCKKLGEIIKNYKGVILFGPGDAKVEIFNALKADGRFAQIKIEIKQTFKMSENQQHAFVRDHFYSYQ